MLEDVLVLGCDVKAFAELKASRQFLADKHYYMHKGKPFYTWLIDFVSWGNLVVLVLEGERIISKVRNTLGPARVEQAVLERPLSIRAKYGMFEGVNIAHASDNISSSSEEISAWGLEFDLKYGIDAYDVARSYISKYSHQPYVNTMLYRRIANDLKNTPQMRKTAVKEIAKLLHEENLEMDEAKLSSFARILIRAIPTCTTEDPKGSHK